MSAVPPQLITDGILVALGAISCPLGDNEAPSGPAPYVVLYPLGTSESVETLGDQYDTEGFQYQVTCVGITRQQAEDYQGVVRGILGTKGAVTPPSGWAFLEAAPPIVGGIPATRDDSEQPPVFFAADIYQFTTVPA